MQELIAWLHYTHIEEKLSYWRTYTGIEVDAIIGDARVAIEQEKKAAIADIRQQVAALSVGIAEKVLKQNLKDDKAQMDLINRMLDDVSTDK